MRENKSKYKLNHLFFKTIFYSLNNLVIGINRDITMSNYAILNRPNKPGATTLSITTFRITTLTIMTFSIAFK